jgi:Na+/H+ antiporter NhaD/arsenite permease-like protein
MLTIISLLFLVGYLFITLEHAVHINKAATALLTGVCMWTVYAVMGTDGAAHVSHALEQHIAEIAGIVFFLLGAMVIVELIDAHDGFDIITKRIHTKNKRKLLWIICLVAFFLSAVLDNLTTTIVMISLVRKLIADRNSRLMFAGMIVIAANAGGAWSPIGDVTTTMLWIGNQITATSIMQDLFLPSLLCLLVPLIFVGQQATGLVEAPSQTNDTDQTDILHSPEWEQILVLALGLGTLLMVPVFKSITHLPPFMAILFGLGIMWVVTERIHHQKDERDKDHRSVLYALRKADTPSILFFTGILLAVSAMQATGILQSAADWLSATLHNENLIVLSIGLLSAIVDNVPLVAAAQGMYTLDQYPTDAFFWKFLAYATGTGGSILIIGSAAGVAAMSMERIEFFWYLKRVSLWALLGYLAGAGVYVLMS